MTTIIGLSITLFASMCVNVLLVLLVKVGRDDVASVKRRFAELANPPKPQIAAAINEIDGVVLPVPDDPRWHVDGHNKLVLGGLILNSTHDHAWVLSIDGMDFTPGTEEHRLAVVRYREAVRISFAVQKALAAIEHTP